MSKEDKIKSYTRFYDAVASELYHENGKEAMERVKNSLRRGRGLCKEEVRFLIKLRIRRKVFSMKVEELRAFLKEGTEKIVRKSTDEDKEFWYKLLQNYRKG